MTVTCFSFLTRKKSDNKDLAKYNIKQNENSKSASKEFMFNDKRLVAWIFISVDGTGNSGENDGCLTKEELKSFLERNNPDKSDEAVQQKVEEVRFLKRIMHLFPCEFLTHFFDRFSKPRRKD